MSNINSQNNNSLHNIPVKTKTTDYGRIEADQHDIISPFHRKQKASAGS